MVGGTAAKPGEFPHMAAVGYPDLNGGIAYKCAGSLINNLFVLTAAHCSFADRSRPTTVRLGDLNLSVKESNLPETNIGIEKFISHPSYSKESKHNDIALIKLIYAVTFSKHLRPACLWQKETFGNSKVIATGWGKLFSKALLINLLHFNLFT